MFRLIVRPHSNKFRLIFSIESRLREIIKEKLAAQPLLVPRPVPIDTSEVANVEETLKFERERALFAIEQIRLKKQNFLRSLALPELKAIVEKKKKTLLDLEAINSTQYEDQKLQLYRLRKQHGLKVVETGKPSMHTREHSGSKDRYL